MDEILKELRSKLESVPKSYEDFVEGTIRTVKNNQEHAENVLSYINRNSKATSSDIVQYVTEKILGIKPIE